MTTENIFYQYIFNFEDGVEKSFTLELNDEDLSLKQTVADSDIKDWALLEVNQCPNCPLTKEESKYCPVAVNIQEITHFFDGLFSYEKVNVTLETSDRNYFKTVAVQDALSSLMGIVMVTSGCPLLDKLRPMVRNHLPFATLRESMYRVISMYFMAQYMRSREGKDTDWTLDGLVAIYDEIKIVNGAFCERLAKLFEKDANINAIVILNCLAEFASLSIKNDMLEDFEPIFKAYLED